MKKLCIALVLLLLTTASASAQEEEYRPNRRQRGGGIVGGGGGVTSTWMFMNTGKLNSALAEKGFPTLSEDGLFMFGGQGHAYIMLIPNLRMGGMGFGGGFEERRDLDGLYQSTKLDVSAGGVTIEYVIPVGRLHFAVGGMLGGGSYTLTLTQAENAGKTWGGLFPTELETSSDRRHELEQSYFAWQPWLTVEYELHPFVIVGLTGGWYGSSGGDWRLDEQFDVEQMPDFDFNAPFVRLGLTFGLFLGEN
ncbi:MAG: hypothetical protein C0600_08965 [Ignavibacteria bacterium]|nr:MAG: hypothetical protein C0600_08965 [Ignavibacteria bacterium]